MYLIDANVLITAKNTYYPLEHIPQFWEWLVVQGDAGRIKMPREIYEEVSGGSDDLADWIRRSTSRTPLRY